jgi:hypothetical protein
MWYNASTASVRPVGWQAWVVSTRRHSKHYLEASANER